MLVLESERSFLALQNHQTLIQQPPDSYKYPVLTLPNEIICEIFLQFLPVYPECPPWVGTLSPTSLTHICRQWRDIALATPTLWRAMYIPLDVDIPFEHQVHELDKWLSRSRGCPFSIIIEELNLHSSGRDFIFSSALCARWEHLKVFLYQPPFLTIEGPMPLLHHLDLAIEDPEMDPDPIVLGEAPLLRSAILNHIAAVKVVLPWGQLTSLTLNHIYPDTCVFILQQTSNLVDCTLVLSADSSGPWPDVKLLCLESLILVPLHFNSTVPGYLETLIMPALCSLKVEEQLLGYEPIEALTSFISKSGCKPQDMYISGGRRISKDVYRAAFPSVKLSFEE
ncbi:hypothetical protein C8F04DRAFT_304434 [Mycena alexandri]|uniref:F-box domain-containing protein n=1 Tax=Mycena alexandri TaxID=1745969 RepID=A0AAD6S3M7_9AGAR|nr:hypothetical protein C8F04DRAFT_304434 [Mycena alexandri]